MLTTQLSFLYLHNYANQQLGGRTMRGKLIEDVRMPTDTKVDFECVIKELKNRHCSKKELEYLEELMKDKDLYDFSRHLGVTTVLALSHNQDESDLCIKISDIPCSLNRNFVITNLLSKYNVAPRVIKYISTDKDYLVTEKPNGDMAVNVYTDFRSLARFMGNSLRQFHNINWIIADMTMQEREMLNSKTDAMKKYLSEHEQDYVKNDVLIHGDFNPRNVFTSNGELTSVIDVADTCFGDRHYDIYFSMWTVELHFGIIGNEELVSECERIFLDSYGRDKIDESRMEICKKLACMYWQEQNDINGLI